MGAKRTLERPADDVCERPYVAAPRCVSQQSTQKRQKVQLTERSIGRGLQTLNGLDRHLAAERNGVRIACVFDGGF
jgi:hypothetical protein